MTGLGIKKPNAASSLNKAWSNTINMLEQVCIGKILKATGSQGAVKVQLEAAWEDLGDQLPVVLLDLEGDRVPFFIEESHFADTWIWKFEDMNSPEEAKTIGLAPIYALKSDLPKNWREISEPSDFSFLTGWKILDIQGNLIGQIDEVRLFPEQWMAILTIDGTERMIPIVEEFIQSIDETKQSILMKLPEGLLDL